MYKLILVDDEDDVRVGILQEIDWESYGFELVETAENGREAFNIVERVIPDVVITDIKMPFMDGLTLSELIKNRYPTTKIIILTGFDEFEFAQRAIKLHIDEYVLKPFSAQELINALVKVKSRIDEEIAQKEDIQALREYYRESIPVLRNNFLTLLITRKLPNREIQEKSTNYDINLNGNGFVASIISIDKNTDSYGDDNLDGAVKNEQMGFKLSGDRDLSLFAVLNITEEVINKHALGMVFIHNNDVVVLTVCSESDRESIISRTLTVLEEVRLSIEKFLKFTVTVGIGTACNDISNICLSYNDAFLALDYRLILGNNRIICIDDLEIRSVKKIQFDELKEHIFIRCIKVGTLKEINETINNLFREVFDIKISYKDYQIYLLEMLTCILKAVKDSNIDIDDIFGVNANLFAEISKFADIQEVKDWVIGICARIANSIASNRQHTYNLLVKSAEEYIQNHYHESDITINKVCNYLHISPAYFSSIFKKQTKTTFINYLTQIRLDSAKKLLSMTNLKSFEIAERVGFADANYFSYSFKKNLGISPSEYRSSLLTGR